MNEQRIALGITELPLPGVEAARWAVAMARDQLLKGHPEHRLGLYGCEFPLKYGRGFDPFPCETKHV